MDKWFEELRPLSRSHPDMQIIRLDQSMACLWDNLENCEAVKETAQTMFEMGLFRLPFEKVLISMPVLDEDVHERSLFFLLRDDETNLVAHVAAYSKEMGVYETGVVMRFAFKGEKRLSDSFIDYDESTMGSDQAALFFQETLQAVTFAMVLYYTKGVKHEKGILKPKLKGKPRRIAKNKVTILRVREPTDRVGTPLEHGRTRPRLHLRSGHRRTQHYGPNNSLTKEIFIEPTMVGYEEDGTITHPYREI